MPKLKITISNPCNQLWKEMDLSPKGRYCHQCDKEVIDFTSMSTTELANWFNTPKGEVCGRIHIAQLSDQLPVKNHRISLARILVASCLTFVTGFSANATMNMGKTTAYYQQLEQDAQIEIKNLEVYRIDNNIVIKVKISSSNDKLPLVGIKISLKDGEQSVFSNVKGNFLMVIPVAPNQKIILVFSYPGFDTKEIEITDHQINPIDIVGYRAEKRVSVVGAMTVVLTRVPWYKRVWNYIKRSF